MANRFGCANIAKITNISASSRYATNTNALPTVGEADELARVPRHMTSPAADKTVAYPSRKTREPAAVATGRSKRGAGRRSAGIGSTGIGTGSTGIGIGGG